MRNDRGNFMHLALIGFLGIILNVALKGTFKIPLPEWLHNGYAFPSGHMQFSTVIYGWLFYHYPYRWLRAVILILLTGIGAGLMYYGYHTFFEVCGGVFFASLIIAFYLFSQHHLKKRWFAVLPVIASLTMLYNFFQYNIIPPHCWHAFYGLLLSSAACMLWYTRHHRHKACRDLAHL